MASNPPDDLLQREQKFFDEEAAELSDEELFIAPDQIRRYQRAKIRPSNIAKDTLFAYLNPLEGKKVLDYGCGHGENACLLAACGAEVTAFDLSPVSVATAKRRAELLGVADRIQFDTRAAGNTGYDSSSFDIIAGQAILHHLHMDLGTIYAEIDDLLKPNGRACFIEPVANSPLLRLLRRLTPVKYETTPDERQMYYEDFEGLEPYFSKIDFHHFYCLERVHRILGPSIRTPLRRLDYQIQRQLPFVRSSYGTLLVMASR